VVGSSALTGAHDSSARPRREIAGEPGDQREQPRREGERRQDDEQPARPVASASHLPVDRREVDLEHGSLQPFDRSVVFRHVLHGNRQVAACCGDRAVHGAGRLTQRRPVYLREDPGFALLGGQRRKDPLGVDLPARQDGEPVEVGSVQRAEIRAGRQHLLHDRQRAARIPGQQGRQAVCTPLTGFAVQGHGSL
jgi:hypothetical protein